MIYIETGSTDVCWNFALEEYFAGAKRLDDTVFLLWRTQPTLMVGKYQNTLNEIRLDYARAHGIQIVRRMSGGGTIYTDMGGWQFTFIDGQADPEVIAFTDYTRPILDALRAMGLDVAFNGRNDILLEGRKISGNAQYKLGGVTVHHGSLLFDTDITRMVESTSVSDEKIISKSIKSVRERVTNISEHLKEPMTALEFKERVVGYVLNRGAREYALTDEDRAAIARLAKEKYASYDWCFGMDPPCTLTRSARLQGGLMEFKLDIRKNVIRSAAIHGDFFASEKADSLGEILTGCPYERGALAQALTQHGFDRAIYGITIDDMVKVLID